jgi:uncharacterized membrane protein
MGPMATILNLMDNKTATVEPETACAYNCHITFEIASDTILHAKIAILIVKKYAYKFNIHMKKKKEKKIQTTIFKVKLNTIL